MTERKIAVAIHPMKEIYSYEPARDAIQAILDDRKYDLTFAVTGSKERAEKLKRKNTLYVRPQKVIATPDYPTKLGCYIIDPDDLLKPFRNETVTLLSVTLVGGEAPGCHSGALDDLQRWFPSSPLIEFIIEVPFAALFRGTKTYGINEPETVDLNFIENKARSNYTIEGAETKFSNKAVLFRLKK